jgi:hypothetical protein
LVFRDIIRKDLNDNFYIYELNDDNGQVATINYMDLNFDFDEDKINNFKKSVIREIRLGKIIDGDGDDKERNISYEIDLINKIQDPKILHVKREDDDGEDMSMLTPKLRTFNIFLTEKKSISKEVPYNTEDRKIYKEVYGEINNTIEEILISEYLELSRINQLKNKHFFDYPPINIKNDGMVILSKINAAFQKISIDNRKTQGNLLIMNPKLYSRHKVHFMKLRCNIFLSDFMSHDKIIATLNSDGVEFFRLVYSFKSIKSVNEKLKEIVKFRLDYGYEKTSISPEDNCILININKTEY